MFKNRYRPYPEKNSKKNENWLENFLNELKKKNEKNINKKKEFYNDVYTNMIQWSNEFKNEELKFPELVICGFQSEGKSTIVESLLGFRFNIVKTEMGTKFPLFIQTQHCKSDKPIIKIKKSEYDKYRKVINDKKENETMDEDEEYEELVKVDIEELKNIIEHKTLNTMTVSEECFFIKVSHQHCHNMNIIDTPGLIEDESEMSDDIKRMVIDFCKKENRILICVEQSTTEWKNSRIYPIIKNQVDKQMNRSIFAITKFENRTSECKNIEDLNSYLEAEGKFKNIPIFYLSLPHGAKINKVENDLDYKKLIYLQFKNNLLQIKELNVDSVFIEKHLEKIGFYNFRNFLEKKMFEEYEKSKENLKKSIIKFKDDYSIQIKNQETHINFIKKNDPIANFLLPSILIFRKFIIEFFIDNSYNIIHNKDFLFIDKELEYNQLKRFKNNLDDYGETVKEELENLINLKNFQEKNVFKNSKKQIENIFIHEEIQKHFEHIFNQIDLKINGSRCFGIHQIKRLLVNFSKLMSIENQENNILEFYENIKDRFILSGNENFLKKIFLQYVNEFSQPMVIILFKYIFSIFKNNLNNIKTYLNENLFDKELIGNLLDNYVQQLETHISHVLFIECNLCNSNMEIFVKEIYLEYDMDDEEMLKKKFLELINENMFKNYIISLKNKLIKIIEKIIYLHFIPLNNKMYESLLNGNYKNDKNFKWVNNVNKNIDEQIEKIKEEIEKLKKRKFYFDQVLQKF